MIVPLHARGQISGWLFFGHRLTGRPFDDRDLETLMVLGGPRSIILENASLHEEVTRQKTLAETLLTSIPPGSSRATKTQSSGGAIVQLNRSWSRLGRGGGQQAGGSCRQPDCLSFAKRLDRVRS